MEVNVDANLMAEFGAIGISLLPPASLLHPSPSQILQWLRLLHLVVSDKHPRSIDLAGNREENCYLEWNITLNKAKKADCRSVSTYRSCECSICRLGYRFCMAMDCSVELGNSWSSLHCPSNDGTSIYGQGKPKVWSNSCQSNSVEHISVEWSYVIITASSSIHIFANSTVISQCVTQATLLHPFIEFLEASTVCDPIWNKGIRIIDMVSIMKTSLIQFNQICWFKIKIKNTYW